MGLQLSCMGETTTKPEKACTTHISKGKGKVEGINNGMRKESCDKEKINI